MKTNISSLLVSSMMISAGLAGVAQHGVSAATATNATGVALYRESIKGSVGSNVLLSPYSIQAALGMVAVGASGETALEMGNALGMGVDFSEYLKSWKDLNGALQMASGNEQQRHFELSIANQVFLNDGVELLADYQTTIGATYETKLENLDFAKAPEKSRLHINEWVASKTKDKIKNLIPESGISPMTRMVLVNALYLKSAWATPFAKQETRPAQWNSVDGKASEVATMHKLLRCGYGKRDGYSVVTLPYQGNGMQFVIFVPDAVNGLANLEGKLSAELLADATTVASKRVKLSLPKFRLEPPSVSLVEQFQKIGMVLPFTGKADFRKMCDAAGKENLSISGIYHRTFLDLQEQGTEAAAATAVVMARTSIVVDEEPPLEVKVDRPFVFAIQHVASGACLFLGRVMQPVARGN